MFIEHEHPEILVPRHISRCALSSVQLFVLLSALAYHLEYYRLCLHIACLYIFSMIHWFRVSYDGIIKKIDTFLATSLFLYLTIYDSVRFHDYRSLWIVTAGFSGTMFMLNEYLFYHQVLYKRETPSLVGHWTQYLSLNYAKPNTVEREWAYYRSVYTHMTVVHFIPVFISSYCAISATLQDFYMNPELCRG